MPSPKVATYDLKPEMSAYEVKDKLVEAIDTEKYDFIVVNYANGDMVGHTGIYPAIQKAVETLDTCLHDTVEAAKRHGYEVIIIADHGNADNAVNADGTPNTAPPPSPPRPVYTNPATPNPKPPPPPPPRCPPSPPPSTRATPQPKEDEKKEKEEQGTTNPGLSLHTRPERGGGRGHLIEKQIGSFTKNLSPPNL